MFFLKHGVLYYHSDARSVIDWTVASLGRRAEREADRPGWHPPGGGGGDTRPTIIFVAEFRKNTG